MCTVSAYISINTGGAYDCQRLVAVHRTNPLDVGVVGAFSTAL